MGIAAAGILIAAAGTAASIYAQNEAAKANRKAADYNIDLAERAAKASVLAGAAQASEARAEGSRAIAQTRAEVAAAGVDVQSEGSVGLLETTREVSQMDVETIKNNALREALGYKAQAEQFKFQKKAGQQAAEWGMVTSALQGLGSMTSGGYQLSRSQNPMAGVDAGRGVQRGAAADMIQLYGGYGGSSLYSYPSLGRKEG